MKVKVTFREYDLPYADGERGEFIGSFACEIDGTGLDEITDAAQAKAEALSKERKADVRIWEIPVRITPRGIRPRSM